MDEVEFFILSEQPFSAAVKESWIDEMLDFYKAKKIDNRKNVIDDIVNSMEEDVADDPSAHASFMTQNEVCSVVDDSLTQMQGDGASTSSLF